MHAFQEQTAMHGTKDNDTGTSCTLKKTNLTAYNVYSQENILTAHECYDMLIVHCSCKY